MRPPKEFDRKPWHWVKTDDNPSGEPMEWSGWAWLKPGDEYAYSPRETNDYGWVWLGVAEPPAYDWGDRGA